MVGVRRFDTDKVLETLVQVFWKLGYEATTVDDLVDATELNRSSLYNAFGKKEQIFLTAMEHYLEGSREPFHEALSHPDLFEAIRGALDAYRSRVTSREGQPGCLVVIASGEAETRSPTIRRRVVQAFADEERAYYDRLRKGQIDGHLPPEADLRALSRFLAAQGRAMAVDARVSGDISILKDIQDVAIQVLCVASGKVGA